MSREEQTIQAAENYVKTYPIYGVDEYGHFVETDNEGVLDSFIAGAKWSDEHSKEGLWDKEKVCNFLYNHLFYNVLLYINADDPSLIPNITDKKTFIEDLCKAMEK